MKDGTSPLCQICGKYEETIDHIVAGCPELAKTDYIERHNRVAKYTHWMLCQTFNIKTTDRWYHHEPKTVEETRDISILWDMPVMTDCQINADRPDIIIRNKTEKTCTLIDISIPSDKNTSVKTLEKLSKYKDLEIEISRMWKVRSNTIPVVVGALGILPKSSDIYLTQLPCTLSKYELQKITLLGSAHIFRRALSLQ